MKTVKKGDEKESPYRRKRYKVPEYLKAMTEIEKEINHQIIKNMSKRIHYLRNPRFKEDKAAITFDQVKDQVRKLSPLLIDSPLYNRNMKARSGTQTLTSELTQRSWSSRTTRTMGSMRCRLPYAMSHLCQRE